MLGISWDTILGGMNYVCSGIATILTVLMLVSYRKPKRFKASDLFFSIALSALTLPVFILVSGARLNIWLGAGLFVLGGLYGMIRGATVKMYFVGDQVIGRKSMLSLAGWGGSLALSSLMNSFDSALLASLGLAPLVFSTGTQVMQDLTLLVRRLLMRPQPRRAANPR